MAPRAGRTLPGHDRSYGSIETVTAEESRPALQTWSRLAGSLVVVAAVCASAALIASSRGLTQGEARLSGEERRPGGTPHERVSSTHRLPGVDAEIVHSQGVIPFTVNNKYTLRDGPLDAGLGAFGDRVVMEPHRETTFAVTGPVAGRLYRWTIDGKPMPADAGGGVSVSFGRDRLWDTIPYQVEELAGADGPPLRTSGGELVLRYVRRELRSLFDEDREAFLSAMAEVYRLSQGEGEAKYGPSGGVGGDFTSHETIASMHANLAAPLECDHLHGGFAFLPRHVGLSMVLERAMQAVDPSVALHYWDFVQDWETYRDIDTIYAESEVLSSDFFGPFPTEGGVYHLRSGRFGFVRVVPAPAAGDVHNPYGLVRAPWNGNPSPFITRISASVMGVKVDELGASSLGWPSCQSFAEYAETNFGKWAEMGGTIEDIHNNLHIITGGAAELRDNFAGVRALAEEFGLEADANYLASTPYLSHKFLWRSGLKECPQSCPASTPPTECVCSCVPYDPELEEDLDKFLAYIYLDGPGELPLEFKQRLVAYFCDDAYISGDELDAGSPNDPIFWVFHGQLERFYSKMVALGGGGDLDDWPSPDLAYHGLLAPGVDVCVGHATDDLPPWELDLAATVGVYSNREVVEALDPLSGTLPYIYDSYDMPYCGIQGDAAVDRVIRQASLQLSAVRGRRHTKR